MGVVKRRVLGIDPGEKRIGVAITDPLGITAQALDVICFTNIDEALSRIEEICRQYDVEKIVVGNPLNMNGSRGHAAIRASRFADKLQKKLGLPLVMVDERLTSVSADKALLEGDMSRKKRRNKRDKLAAAMILETYISVHKNSEDMQ
jgi:putative holliday junction resolvase